MKWLAKLLPSSMTDEQAMRDVQQHGDHAAFARLVERWEAPIRRLATRMTGDAHRGEDLAQETFARVFANRHQFDPQRKFSTWLWQIALNVCRAESRRLMRIALDSDSIDHQHAQHGSPEKSLIDSERVALVRSALARLEESQRIVVILREYEGLKFREIAEVLQTPEGTVKSRMADALAQLGRALAPAISGENRRAPRAVCATKERLT